MAQDDVNRRLETLETQLAYQEQTLEELNQTLTGQWTQIDALTRALARLGQQLADLESQSPGGVPVDKPPHY
jgi:SlyX protein